MVDKSDNNYVILYGAVSRRTKHWHVAVLLLS